MDIGVIYNVNGNALCAGQVSSSSDCLVAQHQRPNSWSGSLKFDMWTFTESISDFHKYRSIITLGLLKAKNALYRIFINCFTDSVEIRYGRTPAKRCGAIPIFNHTDA
jgi:hypothetical protein